MEEIPCKDCLILPVCKNKESIICEYLYDFMEENASYTKGGKFIQDKKGIQAWSQINELFKKGTTYQVELFRSFAEKGVGQTVYYI